MGRTVRITSIAAAASLLITAQAQAFDYEWKGLKLSLAGTVTAGAGWRMEEPDVDLLGKLSVPGQQTLCSADDCMSPQGDPAPNQRLVDARGSFSGVNQDSGNINYRKHDIIAAPTKFTPTVNFSWGEFSGKLRGIAYYDPVNADFDEHHNDTRLQPRETKRPDSLTKRFARGFKWRDAYVSTTLSPMDHDVTVTLGRQLITWGESNLTLFNTLNVINPPDAGVARMPGFQLNEVYQPVPALLLATNLTDALAVEAFYEFGWEAARPDPSGSFFSTNDIAGGGKYAILGFGSFPEDPNRQFKPAGLNSQISSATRTAYILDEEFGYPDDGGQYGAQFKYYAENFNGGTEFRAYLANYHSRLPYPSMYAADKSCTRDAAVPGNFAAALVACNGFNGAINPIGGREPLPVDTVRPFLDYPEDIHMAGLSFNTNIGDWSLAGEYAYRPNMPLPILQSDLLFAALTPALPSQDIPVPVGGLPGVPALFTIPGHDRAIPDFLSSYRGIDIQPNQLIRGYERFKVGQLAFTGIRIFGSSNYFKADQIQILAEVSGTHVPGITDPHELPLEGTGERSHPSPGADGTGSGGVPDALRVNPHQMAAGFPTEVSGGYRVLGRFVYNDVYKGINLIPIVIFLHDVDGISSAVIDNYVEGRKTIIGVLETEFNPSLSAGLQYMVFTGAGDLNLRHDRDNLSLNVRYSF